MQAPQNKMCAAMPAFRGGCSCLGDRIEYSSSTETDACSQCKARGLAASCKPQYDPCDAPSPEPNTDLRERVARLEATLLQLTGRVSPSENDLSTPPSRIQEYQIATNVANESDTARKMRRTSYFASSANTSLVPPTLYSVCRLTISLI